MSQHFVERTVAYLTEYTEHDVLERHIENLRTLFECLSEQSRKCKKRISAENWKQIFSAISQKIFEKIIYIPIKTCTTNTTHVTGMSTCGNNSKCIVMSQLDNHVAYFVKLSGLFQGIAENYPENPSKMFAALAKRIR